MTISQPGVRSICSIVRSFVMNLKVQGTKPNDKGHTNIYMAYIISLLQMVKLPQSSRIGVQPGDVFSIHYPSNATIGVMPYDVARKPLCCGVSPDDLSRVYSKPPTDNGLPVGTVIEKKGTAAKRLPALKPIFIGTLPIISTTTATKRLDDIFRNWSKQLNKAEWGSGQGQVIALSCSFKYSHMRYILWWFNDLTLECIIVFHIKNGCDLFRIISYNTWQKREVTRAGFYAHEPLAKYVK